MKRSRFTDEQTVHALLQVEADTSAIEMCRKLGVTERTCFAGSGRSPAYGWQSCGACATSKTRTNDINNQWRT